MQCGRRSPGRLTGIRIAVHYGCHLLKPRDIMQVDDPDHPTIFEDMLRAIGATPVDHAERIICCGKSCRDCDLPEQMTKTILESIHAAEVDAMGVICPSCFDSFDTGQIRDRPQVRSGLHHSAGLLLPAAGAGPGAGAGRGGSGQAQTQTPQHLGGDVTRLRWPS